MSQIESGLTEITDAKARYSAGVLKYRQMGYWVPDYEPKETDTICLVHHWHPLVGTCFLWFEEIRQGHGKDSRR